MQPLPFKMSDFIHMVKVSGLELTWMKIKEYFDSWEKEGKTFGIRRIGTSLHRKCTHPLGCIYMLDRGLRELENN